MNRKSLLLVAAAVVVMPAAHAEVTLSGEINMGIEYINVGDASSKGAGVAGALGSSTFTDKGVSNFGIANNYSNVTISSVDDLDFGWRLDFAFQIQTYNDAAGAALTNRNSHIGLVSEQWGALYYGANENIYERYFYAVDPIDAAAGLGGNLQLMGNPGGQPACDQNSNADMPNATCYSWYRRDSDSIWYDSPDLNGLTFGFVIGTNDNRPSENIDPFMWMLGVKYVGTELPLQLWGAYGDRHDQFGLNGIAAQRGVTLAGGATGSRDYAWQLGAGYTFGDVFVFANFEKLKYELDGGAVGTLKNWERDAFGFGLKWNLASGYIGAEYAKALAGDCEYQGAGGCNDDLADDSGAQMIGVGYYHNLSKQTQAYVVASWVDNQDTANYGTAGISNGANFNAWGATVYGLAVGLKHTF